MTQPGGVPLPVPAPANIDARSRALRTFVQGLISAVLVAVGPVVAVAFGGLQWTKEYWLGVGVLVGSAVVTACVSYVMRYLKPPSTS
jgi:hypothetical protein